MSAPNETSTIGQLSPDGRWWWDGAQWQPAQPPAPARSPRATLASRAGGRVMVAGIGVIALLIGGLLGLAAGYLTPGPPLPLPRIPAAFPASSQQFIPGVSVSALQQYGQATALVCTVDDPNGNKPSAPAKHRLSCVTADGKSWVDANYDDQSQVRDVGADCDAFRGRAPVAVCQNFFASLVQQLYPGRPDSAAQARSWVTERTGSDSTTVIDGLLLRMRIDPKRLEIRNEG